LVAGLATGTIGIPVGGIYQLETTRNPDIEPASYGKGAIVGFVAPVTAVGAFVGRYAGIAGGTLAGYASAPRHALKRLYRPTESTPV
jgi:hypothetical protein